MNKINAEELLEKYLNGQATAAEQRLLEHWYLKQEGTELPEAEQLLEDHFIIKDALVQHIKSSKQVKLWPRIAVAASVVIALSAGFWFYTSRQAAVAPDLAMSVQNDIAPGKNTATLTLSSGKTITLSDAKTGVVIDAGKLTYNDGSLLETSTQPLSSIGAAAERPGMTASTPLGGTYQVILPDGTKVWLNAASTLKFPSTFAGASQRIVQLRGEAYFEVAKVYNKAVKRVPFIVQTDQQEVEVLGTHFNINSYADESNTKTTLLEGSVRVSATGNTGQNVILEPGQQATLANNHIKTAPANTAETIAWKNGYFSFNDGSIEDIMRVLSRWYAIEVSYQGNITKDGFNGKISRFKNISQVLKMLEDTKLVHFKVTGRRVLVMD